MLEALRKRGQATGHGWTLDTELLPPHQQQVNVLKSMIPSHMAALRALLGLTHQLQVPGSSRPVAADRHAARLPVGEILESPDRDDYSSTDSLLPSV
ncbi:hypothetical protein ABZ504_44745 [Streptomyces mirabilis]|uniref:hypothetical protein n=1 Tax=Streptomyces TaxID=1883 RepID=UPI0015CEF60F|nr:hypothetical protein [Streptomyces sp. OK228]